MRTISPYTATNARLLTPAEVALTFVPIPQFRQLVNLVHSVLLGPRGCGKTTLLKMLTSDAAKAFKEKNPNCDLAFPEFEAIYIPSDVRWTEELASISKSVSMTAAQVELIQRILVSISVALEWTRVFERSLANDPVKQIELCEILLRALGIRNSTPSFSDMRLALSELGAKLTSVANFPESDVLRGIQSEVSSLFYGHTADFSVVFVNAFESIEKSVKSKKWALCYDELEISPAWLQQELLGSLRSIDQRFILKLTWSPVLPSGLKTEPQQNEDFDSIRLWYSHIRDAHEFCDSLAQNAIREKLNRHDISVEDVLGTSVFAHEEETGGRGRVYAKNGAVYNAMKELAEIDVSFSTILKRHDIDPDDPYTSDVTVRDKLFRKIKPIVLLRGTFWRPDRLRSRKRPALYSGKEVLYSMSEGNPRRLLNLINDVIDLGIKVRRSESEKTKVCPLVSFSEQAKIYAGSSNQYLMFVKTIPQKTLGSKQTLFDIVNKVGTYLSTRLLGDTFPLDVSGSFYVDDAIDEEIEKQIRLGLDLGVFIYVGASHQEVTYKVRGARFRLSFILSPTYKLLLRNDPSIPLSTCLQSKAGHENQLGLF